MYNFEGHIKEIRHSVCYLVKKCWKETRWSRLKKYPFDSHQCKFLLGSTGYTYSRMKFTSTFSYSENGQRPLQYKVNVYYLLSNSSLLGL